MLALVGHGEVIEPGVTEVGLLEPTMIVTTLPFGRVVTAPVPQIVEFCGELLLRLVEAPLLGVPVTVWTTETVETLVAGGCCTFGDC